MNTSHPAFGSRKSDLLMQVDERFLNVLFGLQQKLAFETENCQHVYRIQLSQCFL